MSRTDVDDILRDMWATRPSRRKPGRKIAGVATAIAHRYQIDPILVRVGFVVGVIYGGVGIILYLLGWLLLPEEDGEVSPAEAILGRGHSSMSVVLTCVLGLLLVPASIAVFSGSPSMLLGLAVAAAALFLLHRHRGGALGATPAGMATASAAGAPAGPLGGVPAGAGMPGGQAAAGPTGAARAATTVPFGAGTAASPGGTAGDHTAGPPRSTPPAWDPLGVAPFAWDLPEPAPQPQPVPPPVHKHRSAVTPVTIGLALVAGGIAAVAAMYDGTLDGRHVAAVVLAVLGTGLVIGSFVRGGRGLIPLAIPLAVVTWGMTVVPADHWGDVGSREFAPTSIAEVQPRYELSVGNLQVDLSRVRIGDGETVRTAIELYAAGNIEVTVPEGADVRATCSADLGNVQCLNADDSGARPRRTVSDNGEDGVGGGTFDLELIHHGTGNVELKRG